MNKYIELVEENKRPKSNFACIDCPFALWRAGEVEYDNYDINASLDIAISDKEKVISCYCQKTYSYTFDSTKRTISKISKENNSLVVYVNFTTCQEKDLAVNKVLGAN